MSFFLTILFRIYSIFHFNKFSLKFVRFYFARGKWKDNFTLFSVARYLKWRDQAFILNLEVFIMESRAGCPNKHGNSSTNFTSLRSIRHFFMNTIMHQYSSLNIWYQKRLVLRFSKCGLPFLYLWNWLLQNFTNFTWFNKSKLFYYLISSYISNIQELCRSRPLYIYTRIM